MSNRRTFLGRALGIGAGLVAAALPAEGTTARTETAAVGSGNGGPSSASAGLIKQGARMSGAATPPVRVVTPDLPDLPFEMSGGWKVFRLRAEPVRREIAPGKMVDLWGFNGSAPGPTIQVTQGDRVRVLFENGLPEPTSMHWHGFEDSIRYDGMPNISQHAVPPGGRYTYEFTITQTGTFFYHSHLAMQEMVGMLGGFIMHPQKAHTPPPDHDFLIQLQEYAVLPSATVPNSMSMEYNWLVLNGRSGPAATPLIVKQNSRVRIRFVNLGMDHHPMHLHGHTFYVTGTEGGRIPETAWWPGNTVLVGVAQARDIEFVANNPGDWMLHCHLPHHMMNQMSSNVGRMSRMARQVAAAGQPAGASMENGMGMLQGDPGAPLADDYGTSLGRGMGLGNETDLPMANGALKAGEAAPRSAGSDAMESGMIAMMQQERSRLQIAPDANTVPNYPQDAFMEGPMMNMDAMVSKPENYGLPPGWSENMQGMMTFVRVLPAGQYDEVMRRVDAARDSKPAEGTIPAGTDMKMDGMQSTPGMHMGAPATPAKGGKQ